MKPGKFDLVSGDIANLQRDAERSATLALRSEGGSADIRRAKIIATIGPSSNTEAVLRDLLRLGMDVARLNFSHGAHEDHARNIARILEVQDKAGNQSWFSTFVVLNKAPTATSSPASTARRCSVGRSA